MRGAASYLYYRFADAAGPTDVTSPGASAGLAYRLRSARLSVTVGSGFEVRRTLRRLATGASSRTTERGATLQGEVFFQATPLTNLNTIVSYGAANHYQGGAVVAFDLLRARASLQLRGGYARLQYPTGPSQSRPYLGVGIYQAF